MNNQLRLPSFHRQYDAVSRCINDTNCCCNLLVIYIHSMKLLFQSLVYLIINLLLYYIFRRFDCCFLWIFLWIIYHNILHILLIRIYFWIYCIALYCIVLYCIVSELPFTAEKFRNIWLIVVFFYYLDHPPYHLLYITS